MHWQHLAPFFAFACVASAQHWPQLTGESFYGKKGWNSGAKAKWEDRNGLTTDENGFAVYHASEYHPAKSQSVQTPQSIYKQANDVHSQGLHQHTDSFPQADLGHSGYQSLFNSGYPNEVTSGSSVTPVSVNHQQLYSQASSQNSEAMYPPEPDGKSYQNSWNSTNFATGPEYFTPVVINTSSFQQDQYQDNWDQQYSTGAGQSDHDQNSNYQQHQYSPSSQNLVDRHKTYQYAYDQPGEYYDSYTSHQGFSDHPHEIYPDETGAQQHHLKRPENSEYYQHHNGYNEYTAEAINYKNPKVELVPRQTQVLLDALGTLENAVEFTTSFISVPVNDFFTTTLPSTTGAPSSSFSSAMIFNNNSFLLIGVLVIAAVILFPAIGGFMGLNQRESREMEKRENLLDTFYQQLKEIDIDGEACTNMVACSATSRNNNAVSSGVASPTQKIINGFMSYGQVQKLLNSTRFYGAIRNGLSKRNCEETYENCPFSMNMVELMAEKWIMSNLPFKSQ